MARAALLWDCAVAATRKRLKSGERGSEHQAAGRQGGDERQHNQGNAAHDLSPIAFANSVRICNISVLVEIASAKDAITVAKFATVKLGTRQA
jgi:hypothetical protein